MELTRTSIALGLFENIEVEECEITLNPGDWILLYTDGVTEAFSPNEEMFGTNRLFDILKANLFTSSSGMLDSIEGSVFEFIDDLDLSDDLTLAAIYRRNPN
jgi:sigma-B regulation protein RsbU (phosphoserine phosphatase)